MRRFLSACVAVALVGLAGAPAHGAEVVRLLTARPGWQHGVPWFAREFGTWDKYGLQIQHTALDASRSVLEAFAAGQGDLGIINTSLAVNAHLRGVPLVIIAGVPLSDYVSFAVDPKVQSLRDVKGRRVSIWSIPSEGSLALESVLRKNFGYAAKRDFTYVRIPAPNICATLQKGDADAGVVFEPYASACLLKGARRLGPAGTVSFDPPKMVQSSVIIASPAFLQAKRGVGENFLRANQEVMAYLAGHRDQGAAILAKYSGQALDGVALSAKDVVFTADIDLAYHRLMLAEYADSGEIARKVTEQDIARLYDLSLLKAIQQK